MKKLFLFVFLAFLPINTFGQNQTASPIEMTDGYFQAGIGHPVHLVHPPPYPPQWVDLGESVRLWYSIAVRQGEKSPCDRRSQTQCDESISFISLADPKYSWHIDGGFRIEDVSRDGLAVSYSIPIDREDTPLGAG